MAIARLQELFGEETLRPGVLPDQTGYRILDTASG
jgi:hypothetical protein